MFFFVPGQVECIPVGTGLPSKTIYLGLFENLNTSTGQESILVPRNWDVKLPVILLGIALVWSENYKGLDH